ncbi:alpha/beta hydrolase [Yinghuangia seranimata]|uniref:alpha/beta hydrolase n=1 Tax=Yinghuangia seranimata TaxID=408067 RepID=UPI00248B4E2A|nr:alpha/beta hydrolase [Yinghuangia seranimata]MDI2128554.1 alpha/beta hydrolase [Yinghuangia seranimata]
MSVRGGGRGGVRRAVGVVAAVLVLAAQAPTAMARPGAGDMSGVRETYVAVDGADARVRVLKVGPSRARKVLVLVAGQFGAAGGLEKPAQELVARAPDTQVWAVDRREAALSDLRGFAGTAQAAADYYLGGRYRAQTPQSAPYVADWGLATELDDLRRVVLAARDGGRRKVVLGGHSWGATTALAYAGWDWNGRAGYRDLSGLVLIDGGVHDAFAGEGYTYRVTPEEARARVERIRTGEVFDPSVTFDRAETFAVLQQLAGKYAVEAPDEPSALAPLLPTVLRPTVPVTNLGLVKWLYADHPLVPDLAVNPAYTDAEDVAHSLAGPKPGMYEWYWPNRLTLDLEAADPFADTPTARQLGLRLWHTKEIDVPLYSFATGLTHGTADEAAHWVVTNSQVRQAEYARDDAMTHLDPLLADAERNTFVRTVVPFLART